MLDQMMTPLHLWGIEMIQTLQSAFKDSSELMLFLTKLGDPRFAFLIYFPLSYFLNRRVGLHVLWMASVAEWFNAILKWFLFGHRPYWWVHEPGMYEKDKVPQLDQYRYTCETGPGSPSGHAMITAAVWYIIMKAFISSIKKHRLFWTSLSSAFFILLMSSVMISRCFIATHFPHQVFLGLFVGMLVGELEGRLVSNNNSFSTYAISSVFLISSALFIHWFLESLLGINVMWSITSATKWCAKKEWIHLDTTPYFSFIRDASSLFGLGIAQQLIKKQVIHDRSMRRKIGEVLIAVGFAIVTESLQIPQSPLALFYFLSALKWMVFPCLLLTVVPQLGRILDTSSNSTESEKND